MIYLLFLTVFLSVVSAYKNDDLILRHGWGSVSEMLFAHGYNKSIISDEAAAYTAKHYQMVSFASCYGKATSTSHTISQEEAYVSTGQKMREVNPDVKNVFYWKGDDYSQIGGCSNASTEFNKHPEWILYDDNGVDTGLFDTTKTDFQDFWINHIVDLFQTPDNTQPGKPLFDILYLDGAFYPGGFFPPNISIKDAYVNASMHMYKSLEEKLVGLGHKQFILVNAVTKTDALPWKNSYGAGVMADHFGIMGFLDKNGPDPTQFDPVKMSDLLFNVTRSPEFLNENTVQIKNWPGPISAQEDKWPNNTQPQTIEEFQKVGEDLANQALSLFLLIAEDNFWMGYSWFWNIEDFIPFGPDHRTPDNFYPQFYCPLGKPLHAPQDHGNYYYTREFEHATVTVDLLDRDKCRVSWHTDSTVCPK